MDSTVLTALRGRLEASLVAVDQLIAAQGRRCTDCNRRSDDLEQCADGKWRGPTCRKRYEAAGHPDATALPMPKEEP